MKGCEHNSQPFFCHILALEWIYCILYFGDTGCDRAWGAIVLGPKGRGGIGVVSDSGDKL